MSIFDRAEKWLDDAPIKIKKAMNKLIVNGTSYEVEGNRISVRKRSVYVNGTQVVTNVSGTIKVEFEGDLAHLDCNTATVNGNVQDVDCNSVIVNGDVSGDVDATSVKCGDVGGDVDATTVSCGKVKGDVDAVTMKRKK